MPKLESDGVSVLVSLEGEDRFTFRRSLTIGRHPFNELVLGHTQISAKHAVLELDPDGWRIHDLGSSNGTTVNNRGFRGGQLLKEGDVLRFGGVSAWRVEALAIPDAMDGAVAMLEHSASARRTPVFSDRFLIGTGPPCDLVVPEWLAGSSSPIRVILYEESGTLWAEPAEGIGGLQLAQRVWASGPVEVDREMALALGSTQLRILPMGGESSLEPTERAVRTVKEYDLDLHLAFDGPGEGRVRVVHSEGEWSLVTGQRFILLFLLAEAAGEWVEDEPLKVKLWGRTGSLTIDRSALNKLIYDTRQMFISRGVDGWFIEKTRGKTRLRLPTARIHLER